MADLDQTQTPLMEALRDWMQRNHAPFYTPGHKQGQGTSLQFKRFLGRAALEADLPELPGLDNLFAPEGVIQQAQELAAAVFGAEQTWFLANGSTCGIEAAVLATCCPGDKIILPRNVHRSAISALILSGARPILLQPEYDPLLELAHGLSPDSVKAALEEHPDAKAVMMVSPTYYGVCGDVAAIAALTHQYGIPLLVDEAHGPHFAFHPDLPPSALQAGADLVVQSTHKVLSALTQAAMLHVQGERIDRDRLSQSLQLVQSTSPSYLLLASLDAARQQMALQGKTLMHQTLELAHQARQRIQQIAGLTVLEMEHLREFSSCFALDPTRLTIDVSGLGITGFDADQILCEQFNVIAELPTLRHLTFILSLGNTAADIERLVKGLDRLATDGRIGGTDVNDWVLLGAATRNAIAQLKLSPRTAFFSPTEAVPFEEAVNRVSAVLVCPYPPGIPVLLPGEEISETAIALLEAVLAAGGSVTGCADSDLRTLRVVRQ